jgi:hypothetical protein
VDRFRKRRPLGQKGSEQGVIIRDDEHAFGARITLERDTHAPFAITCGIYGWMMHTRFFEFEDEANAEYEKMKASLTELVDRISRSEFDNDRMNEAMKAFVKTYP